MKKTHLLYSLGVALLALPACTDKEIAPEDATQRPADGFLFRPETRADGIPIIDDNRQWIEKVSMTKGLDDSERKEFPNPNEQGDLSTYDDETHQFIARRDKTKEPFASWLNQSTTFYYLGYPNIDRLTNPIKGDESFLANARGWDYEERYSWNGIKYYDFKPAIVHHPLDLNDYDYDWLPTYTIDDVNHVALSTNGIFSYAADILNVAGTHFTDFSGKWQVNGTYSFLSWYDRWNQTVGYQNRPYKPDFSGWYVRSNMVYQYDMDLMKQITHNRVIFSGNKQYKPEAPSEDVAGKDGYLYKTFDMKARMARLIIRVKSSYDQSKPSNATPDQYWLGDLLVMQIPQFFRMDDQKFFPLLDIKEYGDTEKDLMRRAKPKDGEGNHFSLDNARGWTKKMGEGRAFIELMSDVDYQSTNHAYEVSMKFHPIRHADVTVYADKYNASMGRDRTAKGNAAEYNTPNYKTVCDVYIPPFDPRKAPIQGFVRYMEKDGTPIDYANKINNQTGQKFTSDEAKILRANADQCKFLSVNYFPHIRLNIRRPKKTSNGGEDWVEITDIPIGKLNYDLIPLLKNATAVTSDVSNEILKYFPSIVEPGHTYQLDISVGFGGDVEIWTYDSGKLIRHDRIVKYGEVAKPIRDQYDFDQSAPNLVY